MKNFGVVLFFSAAIILSAAKITVKADKNYASCGDEITFTIRCTGEDAPEGKFRISFSGSEALRKHKPSPVYAADGSATVKVKADRPGSVYCYARFPNGPAKLYGCAGVAVEPEKVKPARPVPADFNSYWDTLKKAMDAMPINAELTPLKQPKAEVQAFEIKLPLGGKGKDAYGVFSYPTGAKPRSLPAHLVVHGAGTDRVSLDPVRTLSNGGVLQLSLNPIPVPNDRPRGDYCRRGPYTGYRHWNADSRDKIFFNGMFQRVYRALQFLKSRPEWDGRIIIVSGSSQGGGQALAAGGLDPQVSCVVAHVPALCNHGGVTVGGDSGWPKYCSTPAYKKDPARVLYAADYIDAVNFARNIKNADVLVTTGFNDRTCPPESVFAAFNVIPAAGKKLICTPEANHSVPKSVYNAGLKFIADHIKRVKNIK